MAAAQRDGNVASPATATIDAETRQLAAIAYGEASPKNVIDEMYALASVFKRQRDARARGIKFTYPSHNIYQISESVELVVQKLHTNARSNNKLVLGKTELSRYTCLYESTAAYGGTIFWRFSREHMAESHAREYK